MKHGRLSVQRKRRDQRPSNSGVRRSRLAHLGGHFLHRDARGGLPDAPSDISSMGQSADAEGLELDPQLAETFAPIR